MKKRALLVRPLVLLGSAAAVLGAEQTFRTDINPALLYYQAFEVAPKLIPADDEYFTNTWQLQHGIDLRLRWLVEPA